MMTTENRYTSINVSNHSCAGETFGPDGFPERCKNTRVFELSHSNGQKLHLCEYHIECYWNFWPSFRDAVREIWPVRQRRSS
jgi:hypothetical protein